MSDPNTFGSTCATLMARMLNSVAKGVQLTEIIEPLPVKPYTMQLLYGNDSTIQLSGQVRVRHLMSIAIFRSLSNIPCLQFWNMRENPKRSVKLLWADRSGQSCSDCFKILSHTQNQASTFTVGNVSSMWYSFMPSTSTAPSTAINLDDKQNISKVWFEVDEGDGKPVVQNQGGVGFAVQDNRLMLSNSTCMGYPNDVVIAIAVRLKHQC